MRALIVAYLGFLLLLGCRQDEKVPERFYPRNDHEAYWHHLRQANLLETALGKEWLAAAARTFEHPIKVRLPYQEVFELPNRRAEAYGYRFQVNRGQKVLIRLDLASEDSAAVFIDLFRIDNDSLQDYRHVASADSAFDLGFEPRKDAPYLLRLQPELLRGGLFTLTIETVASLDFPVAGKGRRAIQSFFGDPRDGGRREHHGVDIFAKRHTPILAPTDGRIRSVDTKKLGGKVVWLYDQQRGAHLYFAHLHEQKVVERQQVQKGDTLVTVGNTGNARFTHPHLNFGFYKNGPID
ncbi:MAG: M23 family metallopeptidase, partial [Bacteroidota bacterium]